MLVSGEIQLGVAIPSPTLDIPFPIPCDPFLGAATAYVQLWVLDPAAGSIGLANSDAAEITLR
jgi:hypothetical protein